MSNFFDFSLSMLLLCLGFLVISMGLGGFNKPNCTSAQLHEVIEKVERCSKENAVCSTKMKDKILSEVCE